MFWMFFPFSFFFFFFLVKVCELVDSDLFKESL